MHLLGNMHYYFKLQWKALIMITLGPALFDNKNRLITLSGGYKKIALFN